MTQQNENKRYDETAIDRLFGAEVRGTDGEKIGQVGQVYLDDASGQPEWVTVKTGLFGAKETFVPLKNANVQGENIEVPYTKDVIKDAPSVDPDKHIDQAEEQELYRYYEQYHAGKGERFDDRTRNEAAAAGTAGTVGAADQEREFADDRKNRDYADDKRDYADDKSAKGEQQMTAHEERLNVGKESQEAGRARLRKRVVTEQQQMSVPVQREELVVDRQPVNEGEGKAVNREIGDAKDEEQEIVLHEERPVVQKETVATEKVNVGKKTVTENQTVADELKKEQIEVEGDNTNGRQGEFGKDSKDYNDSKGFDKNSSEYKDSKDFGKDSSTDYGTDRKNDGR